MNRGTRNYEEKRRFIRMLVDCEVALQHAAGGKRFSGAGKNLSANGILFHTDQPLQPGDRLHMRIEASRVLLSVLDAAIEVVRVQALEDGRSYAVASAIQAINR
jgi:hypothetical protein